MKLLKVGLVANAANGSTCETIISALANQDILEVCTPIVSGIQDSIDSVLANIEQEVQIPICKISRVEDALDGKINIIDCCNTESESIRYMVSSFLNNMVDLIIDLPSEICNSKDETALISLINETLSNEDGKPLNWTISGNVRTLLTTGDTLVDDIREAHIALRKDATLIKPRFAVVAKDDTSHGNIASLREEKIMAFGPLEADTFINLGVSGPGVVYHALQQCKGQPFDVVAETIKKTAFQITRMGQMVASEASRRLDVPFGIVDLSLAPTPAVGDSVARILEEMGLAVCGTHGTTAALALLNDAVKKGGVMASGHVGGLSGAFIPVSEDEGMIAAALDGTLTIDKLEAMTCVCSVGLDMIAVPGSTTAETISAIIADEVAVGMVNSKTTAVRVIPVEGADVGDTVEMGGLLGSAPVMPVHEASSADFIARGGRIPAPLQSLKN